MAKKPGDSGAGSGSGSAAPIEIRKYANRRLYNTATGEFVTLEDIRQFVVDGQPFVVTDAKTGNDITSSVLAQIIADQEARGEGVLPDELLRQIIGLYGKGMSENFGRYLQQSMEAYRDNWEQMEQLGEMGRRNVEAFQQSLAAMFGGGQPPPAGAARPEPEPEAPEQKAAPADPVEQRIKDLQQQLDEMRAKFDELARRK